MSTRIKLGRQRANDMLSFILVSTIFLGMLVNASGLVPTTSGPPRLVSGFSAYNANPDNKSGFSFNVVNLFAPPTTAPFLESGNVIGFMIETFNPASQSNLANIFSTPQANKTGEPSLIIAPCGSPYINPLDIVNGIAPDPVNGLSIGSALAKLVNNNANAFVRICNAPGGWTSNVSPPDGSYPVTWPQAINVANNTAVSCPSIVGVLSVLIGSVCAVSIDITNLTCTNIQISCPVISLTPNPQGGIVEFVCSPQQAHPVSCSPMSLVSIQNGIAIATGQNGDRWDFSCNSLAWDGTNYVEGLTPLDSAPAMRCVHIANQTVSGFGFWMVLMPVFTLLMGFLFLFMSLGLGLLFGGGAQVLSSGGTISGGILTNPQGSKLAQVFGIGLIFWSFISKEFLFAWLIFPFGVGEFAVVMIPVLFFWALWERTTSSSTSGGS